MTDELRNLRRLARLSISAEASTLEGRSYQDITLACIQELDGGAFIEEIEEFLATEFHLENVPRQKLKQAVSQLIHEGVIEEAQDGRCKLTKAAEVRLSEQRRTTEQAIQSLPEPFLEEVERTYGSLDEYHRTQLKADLAQALTHLLENLGERVLRLFYGIEGDQLEDDLRDEIDAAFGDLRDEDLRAASVRALRHCLNHPDERFSRGFSLLASRWVMLEVLGVDPELDRLREGVFEDISLFLDANVIIALLCPGSSDHDAVSELIELSTNLGVDLKVFDITIEEYLQAIDTADRKFKEWRSGNLDLDSEDNEIIKTFRDSPEWTNWEAYRLQLKDGIDLLSREFDVETISTSEYELLQSRLQLARDLISAQISTEGKTPVPPLVLHDAKALLFVSLLREKATGDRMPDLASPLLLTRQKSLETPDIQLQKSVLRGRFPCSATVDAWYKVIEPFLSPELRDDTGTTFSRLLGTAMMPALPERTIQDFVEFVAPTLGIGKEDTGHYVTLIQRHSLSRQLQRDLDDRKTQEAIEKLTKILADNTPEDYEERLKEKDEKIRRLRDVIREFRKGAEEDGASGRTESGVRVEGHGNVINLGGDGSSASAGDIFTGDRNVKDLSSSEKETAVREILDHLEGAFPEHAEELEVLRQDFEHADDEGRISVLRRIQDWSARNASHLANYASISASISQLVVHWLGG